MLVKLKQQYLDLEKDVKELKKEVDKLEEKKEAIGDKDPYNCDGMLGYENESPGDGITGIYYDNEDFIGEPKITKLDNQVDFSWDNEEPTTGINQDNFSIRWKFWLRVPVKGKYSFYTETDDGHQLKLNGKPVIRHFWGQTGKNGGNWLESHIGNLRKNMKPGVVETNVEAGSISAQSYPISLEGGSKYKLQYEMYHSVHNEESDSAASFARLYWENEYMEKQIIRQDFLYTENKIAPLKVSSWDPRLCQITSLQENDDAFYKSKTFKLQDIPFSF